MGRPRPAPSRTRYCRPCREPLDTDVAIVGAGVVGCAIARELSQFDLRVTLLEAGPDVGAGTSKANSALLHTGFNARPGTLEARLVARGFELLSGYAGRVGIPIECEPPLGWIAPNAVVPGAGVPPCGRFALRSSSFASRPRIEVTQGSRTLWAGRVARLVPGRSASLPYAWTEAVDPRAEPVRVRLAAGG
jgi:glycine/D-amino acid oxidase-like deaminating enzyme